ncbi:hypothetical protein BDZ97DRAFT_2070350 [Flammula alnicola]|nr:hypothetical protein BDZ97DRAFT_2070350 [Flammula alnicola]
MVRSASYQKPKASPSVIQISGSVPGVLDPTQPSRLLRTPTSILSFASFDPYIAIPHELTDLGNLSLQDELCRPKRIVLETIPGHGSFWRWVPSARKEEDVDDEGTFPRLISICGVLVECSQDQWDIYKLDPKYDCFVKFLPALTVISIKDPSIYDGVASSSSIPTARRMSRTDSSTSSIPVDDDYDSERMIVDDDNTPFHPTPTKRTSRPKRRKSPRTPHQFDFSNQETILPESSKSKRRAHVSFQGLRPTEEEENEYLEEDSNNRNTKFYTPKFQKRARTLSPESKKRTLDARRSSRRNVKQEKWEQEKEARREQRERRLMREVLSEVPQTHGNGNGHFHFADIPEEDEASMADDGPPYDQGTTNVEAEGDSEAQRLAESLRKMAELNADRDRQKEREMRERGEQATARRAKSEDPDYEQKKRKLEESKRKEEARQREEQEQARLRAEEVRCRRQEFLEQLSRERDLRHMQWNSGPWSATRAVERYKAISSFFDKTRFSGEKYPLAGIDIPWPTLRHPHRNTPRDMDWESVTEFFNVVKENIRGQAFNDFVKASLQRFHPDRWNGRNLYSAVLDEIARNEIETAVSTDPRSRPSIGAQTFGPASVDVSLKIDLLLGGLQYNTRYKTALLMATLDRDTQLQEGSIRRIRSAGDIPRRPERAYVQSSLRISEGTPNPHDTRPTVNNGYQTANVRPTLLGGHSPPYSAPIEPRSPSWPPTINIPASNDRRSIQAHRTPQRNRQGTNHQEHPDNVAPPHHNTSVYMRFLLYFGVGRNASHARKALVSLVSAACWDTFQIVVIITMLVLVAKHFKSPTHPDLSEWTACDRPLGVWASIWVVRVILALVLAYWEFRRDRVLHPIRADAEAGNANPRPDVAAIPQQNNANVAIHRIQPSLDNASTNAAAAPATPNLPHSTFYSRLTLLSSLMTLSWFLTAHILEYSSINTCRHSSPHLWWLVFGILCIMYLMVLEVVLLGLVVLVIAPILFIFWNIFLICIGRHPLQNPNMIKPEIGKLPKSVVERIPLVMYIPPPPENEKDAIAHSPHSYPPNAPIAPKLPQKRFKLLRTFPFRSKNREENIVPEKGGDAVSKEEATPEDQEPISWEDNWEHSDYPFVALEGNRAACAICLMDFEEPKRKHAVNGEEETKKEETQESNATQDPPSASSSNNPPQSQAPNISEEHRQDHLKLADAGDGPQPLRLLACGHVFHKTCLDPWLIDVSGRCPVCQRPVEVPKSQKKSRRRT